MTAPIDIPERTTAESVIPGPPFSTVARRNILVPTPTKHTVATESLASASTNTNNATNDLTIIIETAIEKTLEKTFLNLSQRVAALENWVTSPLPKCKTKNAPA